MADTRSFDPPHARIRDPETAPESAEAPGTASAPPGKRPRAALQALGCRLNIAETTLLRLELERDGFDIVPWGQEADVCVVNTCTVTGQADAKSRHSLRAARRHSPAATIAATGCFAQLNAQALGNSGLADVVVGNGEKLRLVAHLHAARSRDQALAPYVTAETPSRHPFTVPTQALTPGTAERPPGDHPAPEAAHGSWFDPAALVLTGEDTRAHIKVQDGCDFMCSFCVIPLARGHSRPRDFDNLMTEAAGLLQAGVRELVLTGVNVGTYLHEGRTLVDVVDALAELPGLARIRISSIEPTTVPQALLERMADPTHALTPFLHLPLQSGSPAILSAMRRRYGARDWRNFAEAALRQVPDLCLGTDVMAGFPGESASDFADTVSLLESLPLAYCHVFPYSSRQRTAAARMEAQVPSPVRRQRAEVLRALSERKQRAFHQRQVGRVLEVLCEGAGARSTVAGYSANYVRVELALPPEVHRAALRNRLLPVRVLEAGSHAVVGIPEGEPR